MKKCYIVSEFGGSYDDSWDEPVAVFLEKEKAEKYIEKNEVIKKSELKISVRKLEKYRNILSDKNLTPEEYKIPEDELLVKYFPEINQLDIQKTIKFDHRKTWDYTGMMILESFLYE